MLRQEDQGLRIYCRKIKAVMERRLYQSVTFITFAILIIGLLRNDLEHVKNFLEISAILLGGYIAIKLFLQFSPKIKISIHPTWLDKDSGQLKLQIVLENISKVVCEKRRIRLQILEQKLTDYINEYVAFDIEHVKHMHPSPIAFREPIEINGSTKKVYPGEKISTEILLKLKPENYHHIGVQFEANLGFFNYLFSITSRHQDRWTSTIITKPSQDN